MSKSKYDVGYGKPPKTKRWKKGQSGNPSGKKKAKPPKPVVESIAEQLLAPIEITQNGKKAKMSFGQALLTKFLHELMNASINHKIAALQTLAKLGVFDTHKAMVEAKQEADEEVFTEEHRRLLEIVEREMAGETADEPPPEDEPTGGGRPSKGETDQDE